MKTKKVLILIASILVVEILISCCNCVEPEIGHYTNRNIEVENLDNSGPEPIITHESSVHKEAFGIRLQLEREKVACISPSNSLLFQSAYAVSCDCTYDHLLARDSVVKLQIFTLYDFDVNHTANSDVTAYFRVFRGNSFSKIPEYFENVNKFLYSENDLVFNFDVLLMTPPSTNKSHSFKITVTLSDGRILEEVTTPIELI